MWAGHIWPTGHSLGTPDLDRHCLPPSLPPPSELVRSLEGQKVVRVACGRAHSVALSEQGQMFVWGAGEGGQLGLGPPEEAVSVPRCV